LDERELRADGEVHPVLDVIDEAIEEALQAEGRGRGRLR